MARLLVIQARRLKDWQTRQAAVRSLGRAVLQESVDIPNMSVFVGVKPVPPSARTLLSPRERELLAASVNRYRSDKDQATAVLAGSVARWLDR